MKFIEEFVHQNINKRIIFTECKYEEDTFGMYANSSEEYWTEKMNYKLSDLANFIDAWNETTGTWKTIYEYCELNCNLQPFR